MEFLLWFKKSLNKLKASPNDNFLVFDWLELDSIITARNVLWLFSYVLDGSIEMLDNHLTLGVLIETGQVLFDFRD